MEVKDVNRISEVVESWFANAYAKDPNPLVKETFKILGNMHAYVGSKTVYNAFIEGVQNASKKIK